MQPNKLEKLVPIPHSRLWPFESDEMFLKSLVCVLLLATEFQLSQADQQQSATPDPNKGNSLPPIKPRCASPLGLPGALINAVTTGLSAGLGTLQGSTMGSLNGAPGLFANNLAGANSNAQVTTLLNQLIQAQADLYQRLSLLNQALMNTVPNQGLNPNANQLAGNLANPAARG